MKAAILLSALVAIASAANCKVFYAGQCPGDADCMCTHNAGCSADGTWYALVSLRFLKHVSII